MSEVRLRAYERHVAGIRRSFDRLDTAVGRLIAVAEKQGKEANGPIHDTVGPLTGIAGRLAMLDRDLARIEDAEEAEA